MQREQLILRVVKATDEPQVAQGYLEGHMKILESYGVTKVTSAKADWVDDPYTYLIVAESTLDGKIMGGGRIQIRSKNRPLPLEPAIAILDERVYDYVGRLGDYKVAEFCGLWNSKEIAGYGVGSIILVQLGVAVSGLLGLSYLTALCSPATVRTSQKVGFEIVRELGNNGTLYYPKEDLVATALIVNDLQNLPNATEEDRTAILAIRSGALNVLEVSGPRGPLQLLLQLKVNKLADAHVANA